MRKFYITALIVLVTVSSQAQDHEALSRFMQKYAQGWASKSGQIGQPMPAYHFNKQLNSKALKGKFVILNFWATWCGGCRLLNEDLDSLMIRATNAYQDIQIIGVNSKEKLADKGFVAEDYWKQKGFGFPTVGGKTADACDESVQSGHPTVILVDDKGIIRGRWDAWTPSTASYVRLATWALYLLPKFNIPVTLENTRRMIQQKDYLSALYFLEILPETRESQLMKFKCLITGYEHRALEFAQELKTTYTGKPEYEEVLKYIADAISELQPEYDQLLKTAIDNYRELLNEYNHGGNLQVMENFGNLYWLYAESQKKKACNYIESALRMAEKQNAAPAIIERLKKTLETYKSLTTFPANEANDRISKEYSGH